MVKRLLYFVLLALSVGAFAAPIRTGVFVGNGPRSNGCVEWIRLINASPELESTLLDAQMIRDGALDKVEVLVVPGGSSPDAKKDLGEEGAKKIKEYISRGGGYIGTCAGTSLLMDDTCKTAATDKRGIGVIPYGRLGSKGGYYIPLAFNEKCEAATGIKAGEYRVRYHAGPVLFPTERKIDDAAFEVWATYADDFELRKKSFAMTGCPALLGGTYGKGKVFAITCHPESFVETRHIVVGAFRYVTGREVTFPARPRPHRALTVAFFSPVISGTNTAAFVVALDKMFGVDLFPMSGDEFAFNMLDHADVLVLPDGLAACYKNKLKEPSVSRIKEFVSRGGKVLAWGEGAKQPFAGIEKFDSAELLLTRLSEWAK